VEVVGLVLAGGSGSRLLPFTNYTHKSLLPIYDKPVIDYALATIRNAGIKDITIVANRHIVQISEHVGNGLEGEEIRYVLEKEPRGVKEALRLARSWIEGKRVLVYFSDNITNCDFLDDVRFFRESDDPPGSVLLVREVEDPSAFGVCVIDEEGVVSDIIEKPDVKVSNLAVGGIYLFDETFFDKVDSVEEDFSISKITRQYVLEGNAVIRNIGSTTWIDCGTPMSLHGASEMAMRGEISSDF
jgi:glucose-1-phosphate thymidylyltransferase